jgi:hypothetical protein
VASHFTAVIYACKNVYEIDHGSTMTLHFLGPGLKPNHDNSEFVFMMIATELSVTPMDMFALN